MNIVLLIIRSNYVINRVVVAESDADTYVYPLPHDLQLVDENLNVFIGDFYDADEELFYRPIGTPPDWPEELT